MTLESHDLPSLTERDRAIIGALIGASQDGAALLSRDGRLVEANADALRQIGYERLDDVLGRPIAELWPSGEKQTLESAVLDAASGKTVQFEGYCPTGTGEPRWWNVIMAPVRLERNAEPYIISTARDVSYRRLSRSSDKRTDPASVAALPSEAIGAWVLDLTTGEFTTSAACRENFGRDPAKPFSYDELVAAVHAEDEPAREAAVRRTLETGADFEAVYRIVTPHGSLRTIEVHGELVTGPNGERSRLQGISLDVTARALADRRRDALIELNDRFRMAGDTLDLSYIAAEILGRTFGVSRAGYGTIDTQNETIDIEIDWNAPGVGSIAGRLHFREHGSYIEDLKRGETATVVDAFEDDRTRDTAEVLTRINARSFINMPVTELGEFVALLFVNNDTVRNWTSEELDFMRELGLRTRLAVERRRAEDELRALNTSLETRIAERSAQLEEAHDALRQSQKLEAIGQLTGGVAHDFNNLLTVIGGSAELLRRPGLTEERRLRHVEAISSTVGRATKLTSQLLAFARRSALKPEAFDVGQNVRAMNEIVLSLTGSRIAYSVDLPDEPCFILADPNQFDTAIVNMATNARDAMNGEGSLSISVRSTNRIPARRAHSAVDGIFAAIEVRDSGPGIPPEHLDRIFEPFFSTKGVGQGTGLGLSQVFGFAKQSGGEVLVRSGPGEGAVFTLYLPIVSAPPDETAEVIPTMALPAGRGLRILVVEDNPEVLEFATRTLSDLGYGTVDAIDGRAALAELERSAGAFDIVFSDVMMPGMTGIELGQEIQRRYANIPVILTSGYSSVLATQGTHGFELLHKPYSMQQLSDVIQKVATAAS